MPEALITPNVFKWARERAQYTPDGAAQKIHVRPDSLIALEAGDVRPTFRQAQNLVKVFRVPFGYLFLPSPPVEQALNENMLPLPLRKILLTNFLFMIQSNIIVR